MTDTTSLIIGISSLIIGATFGITITLLTHDNKKK